MTYNAKKSAKNDLITLLQSFSSKEKKQFISFLDSPFYNTDDKITRLFQVLEKEVLDKRIFDEAAKSMVYWYMTTDAKSTIFKVLNNQQDGFLRAKIKLLLALAKQFLVCQELAKNPLITNQLLTRKLLEKKQFVFYERLEKKQQKQLATIQAKDISYYEQAFQFEEAKMDYLHQQGKLGQEDNFAELHTNLDMYYLANKLKLFGTMHSISNVRNTEQPYTFVAQEAVATLLKLPQYANSPIVLFHETAIQLMQTNEEATYNTLLDLLDTQQEYVSKNDLIYFYHGALNFCISQVRKGKIDYYRNIFSLYKKMDDENILMEKDFIDFIKLKNIIAVSCRVEEFEWANELVLKYCDQIPKKIRESLKSLYIGGIAFYQGDYEKAKDLLHQAEKEKVNSSIQLNCQILLAKSYYEIDQEFDMGTFRRLKTLESFTRNNKEIPAKSKKAYKNFMRILINLYQYRFRQSKQTLAGIREKLEKMEVNSDKKWLLEK